MLAYMGNTDKYSDPVILKQQLNQIVQKVSFFWGLTANDWQ